MSVFNTHARSEYFVSGEQRREVGGFSYWDFSGEKISNRYSDDFIELFLIFTIDQAKRGPYFNSSDTSSVRRSCSYGQTPQPIFMTFRHGSWIFLTFRSYDAPTCKVFPDLLLFRCFGHGRKPAETPVCHLHMMPRYCYRAPRYRDLTFANTTIDVHLGEVKIKRCCELCSQRWQTDVLGKSTAIVLRKKSAN